MSAWNKGIKENPNTTAKRIIALKKWWSNPENRKKQSQSHEHMQGENHNSWLGDRVGYYGLHQWVRKMLGTASRCEHCKSKTTKRYEWANISGDYLRDANDWMELCRSCHIAYDKAKGIWGKSVPYRARRVVVS